MSEVMLPTFGPQGMLGTEACLILLKHIACTGSTYTNGSLFPPLTRGRGGGETGSSVQTFVGQLM